MIRLTDLGTTGTENNPLDIDENDIVSIAVDPVEDDRTVVTLNDGVYYLVSESIEEIEMLIAANK